MTKKHFVVVTIISIGFYALIASRACGQSWPTAPSELMLEDYINKSCLIIRPPTMTPSWSYFTLNLPPMALSPGNILVSNSSGAQSVINGLMVSGGLTLGTPLSVASGGTGVATSNQNFVFAGPAGESSGAPSFRALVAADLPSGSGNYIINGTNQQPDANFNISGAGTIGGNASIGGSLNINGNQVNNVAEIDNGGNGIIIGNESDVITANGIGSGVVLANNGQLYTGQVDLSSETKNVLPIINGGTGASSFGAAGILTGSGTANYLPIWNNPGSSALGTSSIRDIGSMVSTIEPVVINGTQIVNNGDVFEVNNNQDFPNTLNYFSIAGNGTAMMVGPAPTTSTKEPFTTLNIRSDYSATADAKQLIISGVNDVYQQLELGYYTGIQPFVGWSTIQSAYYRGSNPAFEPLLLNPRGGTVAINYNQAYSSSDLFEVINGANNSTAPPSLGVDYSGNTFVNGNINVAGTTVIDNSGNGMFSSVTDNALTTAGIVTNNGGGLFGTTLTVPIANGGTGASSFSSAGIATGSGTLNQIPKWSNSTGTLKNSGITDNGDYILSQNESFLIHGWAIFPPSGTDPRLEWIASVGALRAGAVTSTQWDSVNVGGCSIALGFCPMASGEFSIALGAGAVATNEWSTAIGHGNTANGLSALSLGDMTTASGNVATTFGSYTTASAGFSTAMGTQSTASGVASTAMGDRTVASGYIATAIGEQTTASGAYSTSTGYSTIASGDYTTAMGRNGSTNGYLGTFVYADASTITGFGDGTDNVMNATGNNQFDVRAAGGVNFYTKSDLSTGVTFEANGGLTSVGASNPLLSDNHGIGPGGLLWEINGTGYAFTVSNETSGAYHHGFGVQVADNTAGTYALNVENTTSELFTVAADGTVDISTGTIQTAGTTRIDNSGNGTFAKLSSVGSTNINTTGSATTSIGNTSASATITGAGVTIAGGATGTSITGSGGVQINGASAVANAALSIADGHFQIQQTSKPTITMPQTTSGFNCAGANSSASLTNATDVAGLLTLNTGSSAWYAAAQTTVNFQAGAFAVAPIVVITPEDATTAGSMVAREVYVVSTTTGFSIYFGVADVAATTYNWYYHVIETPSN